MMYTQLKNNILGKNYDLSIALVTEKKSREINKKYKKRDRATNVLSFELGKNTGEIVLCEAVIRAEAKDSNRPYGEWLGFLVVHGMLHLKGLDHGPEMEKLEKKYLLRAKF